MMVQIMSAGLSGIDAVPVTVEVDSTTGVPKDIIVGLAGTVVMESRNRIKSAIRQSGFRYPAKVFTINLAPAELKKEGATFDLPIALGILGNTKQIEICSQDWFVGELGLNGEVRPVRGVLSICHQAKRNGVNRIFVPKLNAVEASIIPDIEVIPVDSLLHMITILEGSEPPPLPPKRSVLSHTQPLALSDIKGQVIGKRVLEIAAAGHHHILLIGSPGSGKSMLLKRLPGLLPPLDFDHAIESLKLQSLTSSGGLREIQFEVPFRSPHHSISYAGMIGGGQRAMPGEISMAHRGILFLDELPEFNRQVIEVLRQPLEDGEITISRSNYSVNYPAEFMLVAAMNPCPCGYYFDSVVDCKCNEHQIRSYWKKLSGPLLDRVDLILQLPRLSSGDFYDSSDQSSENYSSSAVKDRVLLARKRQYKRYQKDLTNGKLPAGDIDRYCTLTADSQLLLKQGLDNGMLSGRSLHKVLKVARTIADLAEAPHILHEHILEAFQYRKPDLFQL